MREHDDDSSFDGSEGPDPLVRELRAEIIRLESQLDQLTASVRERAREAAEIRGKLVELEEGLDRLKNRRQRDERVLVLLWVMMLVSLCLSLYTYLKA